MSPTSTSPARHTATIPVSPRRPKVPMLADRHRLPAVRLTRLTRWLAPR